jgi:hypothetical protein
LPVPEATKRETTCLASIDPCQTVQWAVTEAATGDTVSIAAGTYRGEFQLNKDTSGIYRLTVTATANGLSSTGNTVSAFRLHAR